MMREGGAQKMLNEYPGPSPRRFSKWRIAGRRLLPAIR